MAERKIILNGKKYLHFPIVNTKGKYAEDKAYSYIKISVDNEYSNTFYIKLGMPCDFYAPYYVGKNKDVCVLSCVDLSQNLLEGVVAGDEPEKEPRLYPSLYADEFRQQYHFTALRGWLNDPNGLFYKDGVFHLYFQHNPLGIFHGGVNVSWGHAISSDLICWKEKHDAIYPMRTQAFVASGSSFVDKENKFGYGKDAIFSAHTELRATDFKGYGDCRTTGQYVCVSDDGGETFREISNAPQIFVPAGEDWRDPKLFLTDEGRLCMAVYERENARNCITFYSSEDIKNWKVESRLMDLYECPDIFPLEAETGERKWVLYAGDGKYRIGDFRNCIFTKNGGEGYLDYGMCYAGQTFANYPSKEKRYHIAWINSDEWDKNGKFYTPKKCFSQSMSLACELSLHKKSDGMFYVSRRPCDNVYGLRRKIITEFSGTFEGKIVFPNENCSEATLKIDSQSVVRIYIGEAYVIFDPVNRVMITPKGEVSVNFEKLNLDIFIDVTSIEIFVNETYSITFSSYSFDCNIRVFSEKAKIETQIYKLRSIHGEREKNNV